MKPWVTIARETVLRFSRYLTIERHTIQLPDGRILNDWPWVIIPDYVNVLPILPNGQFLCFRQTKYAADGITLATVGGMIDEGEAPLDAARREMLEEMGYGADEFIFLGSYAADANRGAGTGYLYLALNARQVGSPGSDDLEEQELIMLDRPALRRALLDGEFKVVSWAATVGLALAYLDGTG